MAGPYKPVGIDSDGFLPSRAQEAIEVLVEDVSGSQFATLSAFLGTFVEHGGDANHARPDVPGPVVWSGTVQPNNAVGGDFFFIRNDVPVEPSLTWLAKFRPSAIALADSSPVASWANDISATGPSEAAQADATRRPTKNTINSRAAVTFDGINDRLEITWSGSIYPATYIMMFRPTTLPVGSEVDYLMDTPEFTGTNRHRAWLAADGVHVGAALGNGVLVAPPPTVNEWHILSWVVNGALSTFRVDGVSHNFNTGNAGSTGMFFGGPSTVSANQGFIGSIGDIRVMASALSLPTVQSIETALAYQYGITLP